MTLITLAATAMFAVEVRAYNLLPGERPAFHRIVVEEALALLHEFEVDVVGYGPSPHDENSYYIIRAYRDLDHRTESHARFYGSEKWATGPRDRVLALIESYTTVVWMLDASALSALRTQLAPQAPRGQP